MTGNHCNQKSCSRTCSSHKVWSRTAIWISWRAQLIEVTGHGYEARQTSKEQTKIPRFLLEGPRQCTIFSFALIHYAHTLCMSYVTNTFLLISSSVRSKQLLCFVQGQGQKTERKHTTKNFVGFHNQPPLLTMLESIKLLPFSLKLYDHDQFLQFHRLTQ